MNTGKVMLTGATGFLGSNLLNQLLDANYQISVLKRSTSDLSRIKGSLSKITLFNVDEMPLEECLEAAQPDTIIHCATDYGRKNNSASGIVTSNLLFPLRLLELCGKFKVKNFINTDTALDKFTSNYSLSKKQFREWLEVYSAELVCINLELEHFYGPGDDKSKFVSHLIATFLNNAPELNLTPGEQKRDFTYIEDVINAYMIVMTTLAGKPNGFYNYCIGSNEPVPIKELVNSIQKLAENSKTKINFGAVPYRKNEKMESLVDTSAIRQLGWQPKFRLEEGLKRTIETEKQLNK